MSLNMDVEEWKKGIPQRELEQKIREYEEDYPKREKMTPQARENNQTRFFLEDRFYELHKKELADMLKKQAEEKGKVCFREGYPGIVPSVSSYSDGSNVGYTPLPTSPTLGEGVDSAYSGGGLEGTYSGRGLDSANTGLEASALTPTSYVAASGNGGQQVAGGYGNNYAADYVQPVIATANPSQGAVNGVQSEPARNNEDVSWDDYLKYAAAAALQGYTLGFSDELYGLGGAFGAGVAALGNGQNVWDEMKNGYVENRDDARAYLNEARERAPETSYAAEFGGSLLNPLSRLKYFQVSKNLPRLTKLAKNMRSNVITSGVYGLGQGEGDVANQLATTAKGVAMGLGTDLLVRRANRYIPVYTGPTYRLPLYNAVASLGIDNAWNIADEKVIQPLEDYYNNDIR